MSNIVSLLEAATFLGVSRATLRNWDNDGKLKAIRNPVNGYRMYNLEELINIKKAMGNASVSEPIQKDMVDSKTVKRAVNKLHSIMRDGDANSNIITRFDEISKLLFIKLYAEQKGENIFERNAFENDEMYFERIQEAYSNSIRTAHITIPATFDRILLPIDTLVKCGVELCKMNISSANYDVKGLAYEDTIRWTFDKSGNQQYFTPYQIVDFMVKIMSERLHGTVCDPACGTAGFLTKVREVAPQASLLGLEVDERLAWVSSLNLLIHGNDNFTVKALPNGGSLGNEVNSYFGKIDCIITNPPFGSDYTDTHILNKFSLGIGKASRRRGILFIEQAWRLLKKNGTVAIIVDQSVLNAGSNLDVRHFIINHFKILAVIDLPDTAFMPYANVGSSILIMQKGTGKVEQQLTFFAKSQNVGRKSNGDDDIVYSNTGDASLNSDLPDILVQWKKHCDGISIQDNNCFCANITQNIFNDSSLRLDYVYHHPYRKKSLLLLKQSNYPLYSLAEICEERSESYIPAADNDATTIMFTGLANIESYTGNITQVITPAASIKSAVKRYEMGDIVFSKMRPALRKAALIPFSKGGFVSSECAVLTVRKDENNEFIIDPALLSVLLRSDFVYGQIMGCVTGIGRPRISAKDLRNIKIPIPPKKIQEKALLSVKTTQMSVSQLREKAQLLQNEASELEQSAINAVAKIMSGE